jgi:PhoH-like ATPase
LRTFLLDTNVLLHDPDCLKTFGPNEVIIPISILDELDRHKIRLDDVGRNARATARLLDSLRSLGSLSDGVDYYESIIRVELGYVSSISDSLDASKVDNKILSIALGLQKEGKDVVVVTKDINVRIKCDALKIACEDYNKDKVTGESDSIYSGIKTIYISSESIDSLYTCGKAALNIEANLNQYFVVKSYASESQSALVRYAGNCDFILCKDSKKDIYGIHARNVEQRAALDMLMNPEIQLVTIIGKAGSGKTLISLAAALQQVLQKNLYQRILIARPIQPMGKDIGFLPGDISAKLNPWMQPIYDNLELLMGLDYQMLESHKEEGTIQVEPLTYIRGRSIPNSFMLIDESQNLSLAELKTIITRMGENSKIVLTGDIEQIDALHLDFSNNGLSHVVEKFKEYDISGHITLRKGERSKLATLASEIL